MAKTEVNVSVSRQYIGFTIIIIAVMFLFIGYIMWSASPLHGSVITISASGSVTSNPSQSGISLFLNATGNTSAAAVANLSVVTGRLNATLAQFLEGNTSLIQTQSYNVYHVTSCNNSTYYPPVYPLPPIYSTTTIYCPSPRDFYIASEYVLVTIPNSASTNAALIGLSGIKGVYINEVSAELSQQQQAGMSQQALTLALNNATSQAQALAGGRQLIIVNITVQNSYFYPGPVFAGSALSSNQTFFPGRATVTKSIYVVFSTQH